MTDVYQLKDIVFEYGRGVGLCGVDLRIKPANITAVVGPNGAGKTTLLNLLAFLALPHSGEFSFNAKRLSHADAAKCKQYVGYVRQNPYLLRGSAQDNVELGLKLRRVNKIRRAERAHAVMDLLGIAALAGRNARSLSGGEAQKVAIARALILAPRILILDEPFTYLDKQAVHDLERLILKLRDELKKTVIFTTHNQQQAEWLSDQVYSVIKGRVFESRLVNLFSGKADPAGRYFDTGAHKIILTGATGEARHIAIDPARITLTRQKPEAAFENSYPGRVTGLLEDKGRIKVNVDTGEKFQTVVSRETLEKLNLQIGGRVWISFKSSAVIAF